jgi:putative colanic acid biosynthesis UDP-glucose lipid carrier transferase
MGLRFQGIFDDRAHSPERLPRDLPGPLLGTVADLVEKAKQRKVDIVYVTAIPISDQKRMTALLDTLSDTTVSVYIVPDLFLFRMFHGRWVQVGKLPAVSVFETPFYGADGWIKRAQDIAVAAIALGVLALPMLLIALAVKLTSRGPVLFKQRRYGLDGGEFRMWKFRTMTVWEDGEEVPQARKDDCRVTPLGRLLRRASLDELPQFFNVLRGEMSVVGPRPPLPDEVAGYDVWHRRRLSMKPGITGLWQVAARREQEFDRWVVLDLDYIDRWSLWLDLKIMLRTVPAMIQGR